MPKKNPRQKNSKITAKKLSGKSTGQKRVKKSTPGNLLASDKALEFVESEKIESGHGLYFVLIHPSGEGCFSFDSSNFPGTEVAYAHGYRLKQGEKMIVTLLTADSLVWGNTLQIRNKTVSALKAFIYARLQIGSIKNFKDGNFFQSANL